MAVRIAFLPAAPRLGDIWTAFTRAALRTIAASTTSRVDIFFMIAGLLRAGLDLRRVLDTVIRTAESGKRPAQVAMLRSWQRALADARLPEELSLWLPASEAVIFSAYGRGAIQPAVLFEAAARIAEMKAKLMAAVVKSLAMPAVLTVSLFVFLWLAGAYVLPALGELSDSSRWAPTTVVFHDLSSWIVGNEITVAAGLVAAVATLWVAVTSWSGWGRRGADRFPPFSLYRLLTGWSFLAVMAEFLRVGVDLSDDTFLRLEQVSSPYVRRRIAAIRRQMQQGHPFGRAMRLAGADFPDPSMITVIEALQALPDWHLQMIAFLNRWIERSERVLAAQLGAARSVLMVLSAAVLAATVNSMVDVMGQIR